MQSPLLVVPPITLYPTSETWNQSAFIGQQENRVLLFGRPLRLRLH
jgi:hypothetical protein